MNRVVNLVYPADIYKGEVRYRRVPYPDGQQDIVITDNVSPEEKVTIKSRFRSWQDLELITCTTNALRRMGCKDIHLYCPYLLGARSDRDFSKRRGGTSYLLEVLKPQLDLLNFTTITLLDPHSNVAYAINNVHAEDNSNLVRSSLTDIGDKEVAIVSPDAGSNSKIFDLLREMGITADLIQASKHRDVTTGNFLGFHVPILPKHVNVDLIWIDDICDGGGTFVGEAQEADKQGHKGAKYLIVTHGIFSQGFTRKPGSDFAGLEEYFKGIYSTNSYSDIKHPILKQSNIF
jgi:ribose-phosphate pyrophosphokinase